jgi:hypothetical protein
MQRVKGSRVVMAQEGGRSQKVLHSAYRKEKVSEKSPNQ